jgi:hypothetical protein
MRYFVVGPVAGLDQTARIMVQPVGRARRAPHHDLLLDRHDFDALVEQDDQRMVQTRRIHQNLVVADPFEDFDAWSSRMTKEWSKLDEFTKTLSSPIPSRTRTTLSAAGRTRSSLIDGTFRPSASPRTSPMRWRSSQAPTARGSPARCCAPMAASSDPHPPSNFNTLTMEIPS